MGMIIKQDFGEISGGSIESEYYVAPTNYGGAIYETANIESIQVKVIKCDNSYPPILLGGNAYNNQTYVRNQSPAWTELKTFAASETSYVDCTSLIQSYTYFGFASKNTSSFNNLMVKIKWKKN